MDEQKLITFVVPCYNSQAYMRKCVDSLLRAKSYCQIVIIDDGSVDKWILEHTEKAAEIE